MTTTATVYLASYKSTRPGWPGAVNRAIRICTNSLYSHSEICVGNPFERAVHCLSSTSADGGVRIKLMQLNPAKWDIVALHSVNEATVWEFFARHHGEPYELDGAFRTVLPFVGRPQHHKWFCTEVCADVMGITEPWRMYPGILHTVAVNQNKIMERAE